MAELIDIGWYGGRRVSTLAAPDVVARGSRRRAPRMRRPLGDVHSMLELPNIDQRHRASADRSGPPGGTTGGSSVIGDARGSARTFSSILVPSCKGGD